MGLGLIRIVLAVSVLITHSIYSTSSSIPGAIAVKLFFIISGFYMAMILSEKYDDHRRLFYKNRVLRLFPLYIATVVLIVLFGAVTTILRGTSINNSFAIVLAYQSNQISLSTSLFLLFSNLSMLFQDVLFFLGPDAQGDLTWATKEQMARVPFYSYLLIPQAWSLSLEIAFYLLAPFIIKRIKPIIFWMGISVSCRFALFISGHDEEQFVYRFFPAELVFFLSGSLSYHVHKKMQFSFLTKYDRYLMIPIIATIGIYQLIPAQLELVIRLGLYLAMAISIPYIFNHSKNNPHDNQIGDLSYPFYILHMFVFEVVLVLAPRIGINIKGPIFLLTWIAATMAISYAMTRLVQTPFEAIRKQALHR